jgi:hypothetical protein
MKITARPSAARPPGTTRPVLRLPADIETIARRQRRILDDLLHFLVGIAGRPALDVRVERDSPLQLLPLDDLRRRRLDDLRNLPQRHHPQLAIGPGLVVLR